MALGHARATPVLRSRRDDTPSFLEHLTEMPFAAGMPGWAQVIAAVGAPTRNPDAYLDVFFTRSAASRQAGAQTVARLTARRDDRDEQTTRQAQYDAVYDWGIPNDSQLRRVSAVEVPVFVANGDADPMVLRISPTCSAV
jgi:hypothetical protein